MKVLCHEIYTEEGVVDGVLQIENGVFTSITAAIEDGEEEDYRGYRIIPGIFDTHTHGTLGYDLMIADESSEQQLTGYLKALASQGVTAVFPTAHVSLFPIIAKLAREHADGAKIMGIHSEGPYLNRVGEGNQPHAMPVVAMEEVRDLWEKSEGLLKLFAIAPEIPGSQDAVDFMRERGVSIALAHSNGFAAQTHEAIERGYSVATHIGNAMTGIHHREIGALGECLLNPKIDCEIICDGMHLSLDLIKLMFSMKGYDHFLMISDCTAMAGAPVGEYDCFFPDTTLVIQEDGFVKTKHGGLCGSSKSVLYGIANLVEKLSIPLEIVVRMSALHAAEKYGMAERIGSIKAGKQADFVVIDQAYEVVATYVDGKKVYDRNLDQNIFNPAFLKRYQPNRRY